MGEHGGLWRPHAPHIQAQKKGGEAVKIKVKSLGDSAAFPLKMEKLGLREVERAVQGHPAGWGLGWAGVHTVSAK